MLRTVATDSARAVAMQRKPPFTSVSRALFVATPVQAPSYTRLAWHPVSPRRPQRHHFHSQCRTPGRRKPAPSFAPVNPPATTQGTTMDSSYVTRDKFGMYANASGGPGPEIMGADTLLGNDVYNRDGEDLGDIKEFMIDMASGKVEYAVLSFGGILGLGDKLFAVPWKALTLDTENKRFTLDANKESLDDAPGFDKDHWPSMADKSWAANVHKFYGTVYHAD